MIGDDDVPLVRQVLQAQEYWRLKGLRADVVIVNEHPVSYLDEMHAQLDGGARTTGRGAPGSTGPAAPTCCAPIAWARPNACCSKRWPARSSAATAAISRAQLDRAGTPRARSRRRSFPTSPRRAAIAATAATSLAADDAWRTGSAASPTTDGAYAIVLDGAEETPMPWVNVIANPHFGTIVTASGAAHTWSGNSRENRLTPFANDPISDPTGEALFVRDEDTGESWSPTPGPIAAPRRAAAASSATRRA